MSGRRRYIRYPILDGHIEARTICGMETTLFSISLLGATIGHSRRLVPGADYLLVLNGDWGTLELNAELLWQKETGQRTGPEGSSSSSYMSELRFMDILTNKGLELKNLLELEGSDSPPRIANRVTTAIRGIKASVMEFVNCPVRNMSLGGMLIERPTCLGVNDQVPIEVLTRGGEDVLLRGRVASCFEPAEYPDSGCRMGIEFANLTDGDWMRLHGLVDTLARSA